MAAKNIPSLIALQKRWETRLDTDMERLPTMVNSEPGEPMIRSILREIEAEFTQARERNDQITVTNSAEAKKYCDDDIFENLRISYHRLYARLCAMVPKQEPYRDESNTTINQSQYTRSELKLPKVELLTFNGAYEDWMAFNNMFTATVHNNTMMDPVVKLQRLKGALSGEAELVIRNLELNQPTIRGS